MPDPLVAFLLVRFLVKLLPVDIGKPISVAMGPPLDAVKRPWARHANMDSNVDPTPLVGLPEGGHQIPNDGVVNANRLWVDEDADFWDVCGLLARLGVLRAEGWQILREALGDFP